MVKYIKHLIMKYEIFEHIILFLISMALTAFWVFIYNLLERLLNG